MALDADRNILNGEAISAAVFFQRLTASPRLEVSRLSAQASKQFDKLDRLFKDIL